MSKIDENSVRIHDNENDEDTLAIVKDKGVTLSNLEDLSLDSSVKWEDNEGNLHEGKILSISEDYLTVVDANKEVTNVPKNQVRLLTDGEYSIKASIKDDSMIFRIDGVDVIYNPKTRSIKLVDSDEYLQFNVNPSTSLKKFIEGIKDEISKFKKSNKSFSLGKSLKTNNIKKFSNKLQNYLIKNKFK